MTVKNGNTHIYGFEDYNIVSINSNILKQKWDYLLSRSFMKVPESLIITKDLSVKASLQSIGYYGTVTFEPALCENHPELLNTATKIYTHPSCKLSRTMMAEKYRKSLNPYLSDAVVIPEPSYQDLYYRQCALFINEAVKIIVLVQLCEDDDKDTINKLESTQEGELLWNLITCGLKTYPYGNSDYTTTNILDAGFMYCGGILHIPNTHSYIMDLLTGSIPADKIVFEKSVQESLGTANNQLDFNSLTSIKDMLESSDSNTVAAGLKSLSMMDWMHYSNSVKYIMNLVENYSWRYNNAVNSTSVKYMLRTLSNSSNRRRWPGNYSNSIYNEDYELFTQLKMHYDKVNPEDLLNNIRFLEFIGVNSSGIITPVIKEKAV